jgi:aryl-alcohol dehydrogenase-like predicted oxidoreductase
MDDVPLVLGGHSFIEELGADRPIDAATQRDLVAACLDAGIGRFDTTYEPERAALGNALDGLGRTDEAAVTAWNFFGEALAEPRAYEPGDIDDIRADLGVETVDYLVVHPVEDEAAQARQEDLAVEWQDAGLVEALGTWNPGPDAAERFGSGDPYSFMVQPYNVATDAAESFAAAAELGWETLAASPFVRGWALDDLVAAADTLEGGESGGDGDTGPGAAWGSVRARLADHMLRYALFRPHVDQVVVAMRAVEYVRANVESAERGPLDDSERAWLDRVVAAADDPGGG